MSTSDWEEWFEKIWEYREETIYPQWFGQESRGIFPLSRSIFTDAFKQESFDPRWLHYGVFEFSPCGTRKSWLYVTSGMSNPWDDVPPKVDGLSGIGCEFVLESTEQGNWAIVRLQHLMAFQILLCCNRYPGKPPLGLYDRIPLGGPIVPEPSEVQRLMLVSPESFQPSFVLESGKVELISVFGITNREAEFAKEHGGDQLVELLKQSTAFPVTDPHRTSAVD